VIQTVYYLVHKATLERHRYYKTRAGARIAQRARNSHLGFTLRVERIELNNLELERCCMPDGTIATATWCIEENTIEIVE
jgi:hypothetical protein